MCWKNFILRTLAYATFSDHWGQTSYYKKIGSLLCMPSYKILTKSGFKRTTSQINWIFNRASDLKWPSIDTWDQNSRYESFAFKNVSIH